MTSINKEVTRDAKDLKSSLLTRADHFPIIAILSWLIIFGLETYFYNVTGNPETTYISGFFTWAIGIPLFILLRRRSISLKKYFQNIAPNNSSVTEKLIISESGISVSVSNYYEVTYDWRALTGTTKKKDCLYLYFAGYPLVLRLKHFTRDELDWIDHLLKKKTSKEVESNA
jgi:hypothetical protein